MKSNRMRTCWLLLMALVLGCSFLLSVNQTQARYTSTAVWNTVVQYEAGTVSSNCLSREKQIILLGQLDEQEREIAFTLEASQTAESPLEWSCNAEDYLNVAMQVVRNGIATDAAQKDLIELPADAETTVLMKLALTQEAMDTPHEEMQIDVVVRYGDLSGTFRMTIPAVAEKETTEPTETEETTDPTETEETTDSSDPEDTTDSSEPEDSTDSSEPEDTTDSSDPEDTTDSSEPENSTGSSEPEDSTGSSEPEGTTDSSEPEGTTAATGTGATTDSTDADAEGSEEAAIQPEEPIPAETEETESADTAQMSASGAKNTLNASEEENTAPSEEGDGNSEPTETQPEGIQSRGTVTESQGGELPGQETDPTVQLGIRTLTSFDPTALLPVSIDIPADVQKILLGIAGEQNEEQLQLEDFPPFTRYCREDVWYLLYDGGKIELDVSREESVTVLLELSAAEAGKELVFAVAAYRDDAVLDTAATNASANVDFSGMETAQYLMTWFHSGTQTLEDADAEERSFTIELPVEWVESELDIEYSLERLCSDETGSAYQEVDLEENPLVVDYVREAKTHTLTVSIQDALPPAGTYRLCMRFSYAGICFKETQTLFWIHYT